MRSSRRLTLNSALLLLLLSHVSNASWDDWHDGHDDSDDFSNEWIVKINLDGTNNKSSILSNLTARMGMELVDELVGFDGYFRLRKSDHPEMHPKAHMAHTRSMEQDAEVVWVRQLFKKIRVKRRPDLNDVDNTSFDTKDMNDLEHLLISTSSLVSRGISSQLLKLWEEEEARLNRSVEHDDNDHYFDDPFWMQQWYMHDTRSDRHNLPKLDLNVISVYDRNITGRDVRVLILDDGLEHTHRDLAKNYDPEISYNYNDDGSQGTRGLSHFDPMPRYVMDEEGKTVRNSHGTRCAGEVAMVANNEVCGVGMAHGAKIGGIRMLDGKVNDRVEGLALQHAVDKVDIYTSSWGPMDDGQTLEAPGHLAQRALAKGVAMGRKGRGAIYVWAAGNGGMYHDNCNCDGYVSSIYTLSIGSASEEGKFPWYGEKCSSTMAVTYSSGAYRDQKITTTDLNDTCTVGHTGTSAAAPLAAGIIALALEANPELSWRDVQYLTVLTSSSAPLKANSGWQMNAAGLNFNAKFGFGMMDADKLVQAASKWESVSKQLLLELTPHHLSDDELRSQDSVIASFRVSTSGTSIRSVEHVQAEVSLEYPLRGVVEIALISPSGTVSQLLTLRPKDRSQKGLKQWPFTSVHFWGESPIGFWKLHIVDRVSDVGLKGLVSNLRLRLYGTEKPMPKDL